MKALVNTREIILHYIWSQPVLTSWALAVLYFIPYVILQ